MPDKRTGTRAAILLCCAVLRCSAAETDPPSLDFVYITSTVDLSAGGHSALRLGQTVYHFQLCPGGLFLLARDPWSEFQHTRNGLGNRSITIHRVAVTQTVFDKVRSNCLAFYLQQQRRLQTLQDAETELDFIRRLAAGECWISVEGLGFFETDGRNDPVGVELREQIQTQLGSGFLHNAMEKAGARLPDLTRHPDASPIHAGSPAAGPGTCYKTKEALSLREALRVLLEARPLRKEALLTAEANTTPLTDEEQAAVAALHKDIEASIFALLRSERPERGRALLLEVARYHATSHSLATRRLATLDPFPDTAQIKPLRELSGREPHFDLLLRECRFDVAAFRAAVTGMQEAERSRAYGRLEEAQGRLYELEQLVSNGDPVRVEPGHLVPGRRQRVPLTPRWTATNLSTAVQTAKQNAKICRQTVQASAAYNVLTQNCATELMRLVNESFCSRREAEEALGGYIEPGDNLSFIPCRLSRLAGETFAVSETLDLPSCRLRRVADLQAETGRWIRLRENNTLTSTVYTPWHADTIFLFFTDDVFWPRPILGAANLVYAHAHAAGGIVMLPFDRGRHLRRSLRGILFSLPELAFSNIRKGSFQAVPLERLSADFFERNIQPVSSIPSSAHHCRNAFSDSPASKSCHCCSNPSDSSQSL